MNTRVRNQLKIVLNCLAILSLLGTGIVAVPWSESSSKAEKFRTQGFVAMATVYDQQSDRMTTQQRKGKVSSHQTFKLYATYDKNSKVRYAELGESVQEAALPVLVERISENIGIISVGEGDFEKFPVGVRVPVVYTADQTSLPVLVEEVCNYSERPYQLGMGGLAVLAVVFFLLRLRLRH